MYTLRHQQIDYTKLQKNNQRNQHPNNLVAVKFQKLNSKTESCHQFQNNASFAMFNEKRLYPFQNFVVKTIIIMSDIANSVLLASDNDPSGGPSNHVNTVKGCMNGITLLGHVLAEFEQKHKKNLQNIVHKYFVALWTKTRLICIQSKTKEYMIKIPPW